MTQYEINIKFIEFIEIIVSNLDKTEKQDWREILKDLELMRLYLTVGDED